MTVIESGKRIHVPNPDTEKSMLQVFKYYFKPGESLISTIPYMAQLGILTRAGRPFSKSHLQRILTNPFYIGINRFNGKEYPGAQQQIIPKALFEQVQQSRSVPNKAAWGTKNFAFKEIFKCGTCGASITAEEKFKKRVDGSSNRHVYYHCSRQVDYSCKEPYLKEERLIEVLLSRVDKLTLDSESIEPGLVTAINKFSAMVKTTNPKFSQMNAFREYAAYVLTAGTDFEKTRLVRNISTTLALHNRTIVDSPADLNN